jgi:hypothetical protein
VAYFNTSIPAKKNFPKLFGVTLAKNKLIQACLKRFNKEMLKVEKLIKHMAFEAMICGVKEKALWKKLYSLLIRSRKGQIRILT